MKGIIVIYLFKLEEMMRRHDTRLVGAYMLTSPIIGAAAATLNIYHRYIL